jgi:hypothetical protein
MSGRSLTVLVAVASIIAAPAGTALGQRMEHEFTEEELLQVYRRFVPEPEARGLARASLPSANAGKVGELRHSASGMPYRTEEHTDLTFDTLVMLSLLSDEANAKAERYLAAMHGGRVPLAERTQWERRRAEIKDWANAGYPITPD